MRGFRILTIIISVFAFSQSAIAERSDDPWLDNNPYAPPSDYLRPSPEKIQKTLDTFWSHIKTLKTVREIRQALKTLPDNLSLSGEETKLLFDEFVSHLTSDEVRALSPSLQRFLLKNPQLQSKIKEHTDRTYFNLLWGKEHNQRSLLKSLLTSESSPRKAMVAAGAVLGAGAGFAFALVGPALVTGYETDWLSKLNEWQPVVAPVYFYTRDILVGSMGGIVAGVFSTPLLINIAVSQERAKLNQLVTERHQVKCQLLSQQIAIPSP